MTFLSNRVYHKLVYKNSVKIPFTSYFNEKWGHKFDSIRVYTFI